MTLIGGESCGVKIYERGADYCRIAIAPPFAGLRRFPEGRGFNQWMDDDSKALMKVSAMLLKEYV